MKNVRLSRALCAIVGESLVGSHATLEALFRSSGAPGEPPDLAHHSKWKEWLFRAGEDQSVDSLRVLGNILDEFMDVEPVAYTDKKQWKRNRDRVEKALADSGLEYYPGGRVIPNGTVVETPRSPAQDDTEISGSAVVPTSIDGLLGVLVRGLPRAMHPLSYRRKGANSLAFRDEYDVQDLLHALMRPWVADVRAEEFTPSYAGTSSRADFLLPEHSIVIETKIVRDSRHARKIGDELIIDIAHYAAHPKCTHLWCVVYDPDKLIENVGGFVSDLEGIHGKPSKPISVKVIVV